MSGLFHDPATLLLG